MKNCLEFTVIKLTQFIMTFGVFKILDVLNEFQVVTDVVTLDQYYLKTTDLTKMKFAAIHNEYGYNLKKTSDIVWQIVQLIINPASPNEALQINSALKALSMKHNKLDRFYDMLHEGLHRRMLFTKLSQIYSPLIEEVNNNQELLIMLINNQLVELNGNDQTAIRIAHHIVHNINSHEKLKKFTYIVQNYARDSYMIEELEEIVYEIELWQCQKINQKIIEDSQNTNCALY